MRGRIVALGFLLREVVLIGSVEAFFTSVDLMRG